MDTSVTRRGPRPIVKRYTALRTYRLRAGLTQRELAHKTGIDQTSISRSELGREGHISEAGWLILAGFFGTTVETLKGESCRTSL